MEFKKNQEIELMIDDLGNNGEGIGHVDGYALFVKDALPGERIRAGIMKCKKNYGFARLLEILPGEGDVGRVEPRCPVARQCGGCTLQHLSYVKQLEFKEKKVRDCLVRIGNVDADKVQWLPILGMTDGDTPWNYRNKAQFPVRMQRDENGKQHPVTGFFAGRTHAIIPIVDCAIQDSCMKEILEHVLAWMEEQRISAYVEENHQGVLRHIFIRRGYHTGEIMVCLVVNAKTLPDHVSQALIERLRTIPGMTGICYNVNTEKTNVILGSKMVWIWGKQYIEDTIGNIRYRISPQSFYQINPVQTEKLYRTVLDFAGLTGNEVVWDLYCGIGTISLFLAKQAGKVFGVEIVPEAIENAKENAKINGIENVEFVCGAAEKVVPEIVQSFLSTDPKSSCSAKNPVKADVVVVDPPRKGCDAVLLDTIEKMAPKRLVYVSCDPATLGRDVKRLTEKGYEVKKVRACDMFPQGGHVETVVLLQRKDM